MSAANEYTFDLAEDMVNRLEEEFGPEALSHEIADSLDGEVDNDTAKRFFEDFGRRWMARAIELGEDHKDRTYELLLETAAEIPEMKFPFIPQRYIEIAYLSTQPIYTVPIAENGAQGLVFKMPFCGYFKAIQESRGDEFARELHCAGACKAACEKAFEFFGHDVNVGHDAKMTDDGLCQFSIRRA